MKEKEVAEDEMARWDGITDSMDGLESEQTPRDGEGQGSLACCSPWDSNELDTT